MNNNLSAIRNPGQLACAWAPTGNARMPLACIWREASPSQAERTDPSSLKNEPGGIALCA
jgi:hypothetical protein